MSGQPEDRQPSSTCFVSWSGGKDSCLALHRAKAAGLHARSLLTMLTEAGSESRGHHLPIAVLRAQAACLGIPLVTRSTTWDGYEAAFLDALRELRAEGLTRGVFGDIDLDPHREWVERVCAEAGVSAEEPLWLQARRTLVEEFLSSGYEATVVSVKEGLLDPALLGRRLDLRLIAEFEAAGIDACGEEGEYHTVVTDGPLFRSPLILTHGGLASHDGYCFLELTLG